MNVLVLTLASIAALPDVANDNQLSKLCHIDRQGADGERVRFLIQIRDYHFVPRQAFAADLLDQDDALTAEEIADAYAEHLQLVKRVQAEQAAVLSRLVNAHGIEAVHVEGLTDPDLPIFESIIRSIRRTKQRSGKTWLRIGPRGRCMSIAN